jgi:hypothetical protein
MKSATHSRAASVYRGDNTVVTTGNRRHVSIELTHEQFATLDAVARVRNITRGALARHFVLTAIAEGKK